MDPLSITASVAGILALTGTIISKGYACILRVKKNKSDVQAVLNEVAGFSGILVGLNARYLKTEDSNSTSLEWLSKCHETMWQDTIKDCEKTLKEIEAILESLSTANVIQLVVKGESKANKLEKLLSKLERFKSFFVLCLQLQNKSVFWFSPRFSCAYQTIQQRRLRTDQSVDSRGTRPSEPSSLWAGFPDETGRIEGRMYVLRFHDWSYLSPFAQSNALITGQIAKGRRS